MNADIINFLEAIKSLATLLGHPTLYSQVFTIITDNLNIDNLVDVILKQKLSNIEIALRYTNYSQFIGEVPGQFNGITYSSNVLTPVIVNFFIL
jgi:hypothetical protein